MGFRNLFKHKPKANRYYIVLDNVQNFGLEQLEKTLSAICQMYRDYPYVKNSFINEMAEHGIYVFNEYNNFESASEILEVLQSQNLQCSLITDIEYQQLIEYNQSNIFEYITLNGTQYPIKQLVEEKPFDEEFIARTTQMLLQEQGNLINGASDSLEEMFENDFYEVYTKKIND